MPFRKKPKGEQSGFLEYKEIRDITLKLVVIFHLDLSESLFFM